MIELSRYKHFKDDCVSMLQWKSAKLSGGLRGRVDQQIGG